MEYFPHLNLGQMQIYVSLVIFVVLLLFFILFSIFMIKRKRFNIFLVLGLAILLFVPSCNLLDKTLGQRIFTNIHQAQNHDMPEPSTCIEYKPCYSYLDAKYKVSPDVLKKWVDKYKLKEEPENTFKSKFAENGQQLTAVYDPNDQVLTIKYFAF